MNAHVRPAAARRRASALPPLDLRPVIALAVPAAAALALYAVTVGFSFVWDDIDLIVHNGFLHAGRWDRLLFADYWAWNGGGTGMWRPLVMASFRMNDVFANGAAGDRKSTRLNSSHSRASRMPSSA